MSHILVPLVDLLNDWDDAVELLTFNHGGKIFRVGGKLDLKETKFTRVRSYWHPRSPDEIHVVVQYAEIRVASGRIIGLTADSENSGIGGSYIKFNMDQDDITMFHTDVRVSGPGSKRRVKDIFDTPDPLPLAAILTIRWTYL